MSSYPTHAPEITQVEKVPFVILLSLHICTCAMPPFKTATCNGVHISGFYSSAFPFIGPWGRPMGVKNTGLDYTSATASHVIRGPNLRILTHPSGEMFPRRIFCPPHIDPWQTHSGIAQTCLSSLVNTSRLPSWDLPKWVEFLLSTQILKGRLLAKIR